MGLDVLNILVEFREEEGGIFDEIEDVRLFVVRAGQEVDVSGSGVDADGAVLEFGVLDDQVAIETESDVLMLNSKDLSVAEQR